MATTKNAQKQGVSKFQQILSAEGQNVLDRRSELTFKAAKKAMDSHLQKLQDSRDEKEMELLNLTDISVETRDSLRPGSPDFNPKQWVGQLVALRIQIAEIEEQIAISEEVAAEFFAPVTE